MIDRWIYNFFAGLDRMCEAIAKCMESKPKKKNVSKNVKQTRILDTNAKKYMKSKKKT